MPGRACYGHGNAMVPVAVWLAYYEEKTQGVQALIKATVILDAENEPQPDVMLRVIPEFGGQTRNEGRYIAGPPELVVEVSRSTRFVNLGPKLAEYERAGVREYMVRAVEPDEVFWYTQKEGRYMALAPDADGLFRSRAFPGLWLDPQALLARDFRRLREVIDRGTATPEHAAFVARLAESRGGS